MMDPAPLSKARIFRGFSAEEIEMAGALAQEQRFSRGDVIFREGAPGSYLYLVIEGSVSIHCGDKCLAKCRAYEAFGEMAAFGQRRRSATARAVTDVEVLLFDEAALRGLLARPVAVPFLLNVIDVLCERLEAGNTWIACSLEAQRRRS